MVTYTDFNGDGKTDILWRNKNTGENTIWQMDGTIVTARNSVQQYDLSGNLIFGDFNGDRKTDILWYDESPRASIWLMNGATIATQDSKFTLNSSKDIGVGDFNGDGKTDVFWRNNIVPISPIWLMDGTRIAQENNLRKLDSSWISGIGDFNGDGKSDVFWRNVNTGENGIWLMDGTTITEQTVMPQLDKAWVPSIVDFNGDGKSDVFWRNTVTGVNATWIMDGTNATGTFLPRLDTSSALETSWAWSVVDFNGDGKSDIFWRNTVSGVNATWIMDGTNATGAFLPRLDTPAELETSWTWGVGDFNADGKSDIFWRNSVTGVNATWTMDGTNATGTFLPTLDNSWSAII